METPSSSSSESAVVAADPKPARVPKPGRVRRPSVPASVAAVVAAMTTIPGMGIGWAALWAGLHAVRAITPKRDEPIPAGVIADAVRHACAVANQPDNGTQRIGRFTGMGIVAFQNALYVHNARPDWRFTDAVLTVAWAVEFPHAVCSFASTAWIRGYVGSTRSDYNRGKHGTLTVPTPASIAYRRDGTPVAANVDAPKPAAIVNAA